MTKAIYLEDSYLKSCTATVTGVQGTVILLDQTIFYPTGGGQACDTGTLLANGEVYRVTSVQKVSGALYHQVDRDGLGIGDQVTCTLDWDRRHRLMRSHTAAHLLSGLLHQKTKASITGNQLEPDKSRMDFSLAEYSPAVIDTLFHEANQLIKQNIPVKVYTLTKEQALVDEALFKLANKEYVEHLQDVRVVEIEGVDKQADGGTHVKSLGEIGKIFLQKIDNKGKNNRRVYFTVNP
ncbi:alanyl-tRNA editing protein [Candidatus Woesearchaeota archaeon]|nr:alanyl-tRNA editing protein [Candidatus Woesearchaeota archaeon]